MAAKAAAAGSTPKHPAPAREQVGLFALLFGLFGAHIAWSAQIIANYIVAAYVCFPGPVPVSTPVMSGAWFVLLGVSLFGFVVSLAAGLVSYRSWRRVRRERQRGDREASQALETGEGRTRFLALAGMLVSFGLLLVTVFDGLSLFLVPLCLF